MAIYIKLPGAKGNAAAKNNDPIHHPRGEYKSKLLSAEKLSSPCNNSAS